MKYYVLSEIGKVFQVAKSVMFYEKDTHFNSYELSLTKIGIVLEVVTNFSICT